ncbi:MAG: hypothetical protein ABJN26_22510 [Stappiaceae bacterium]
MMRIFRRRKPKIETVDTFQYTVQDLNDIKSTSDQLFKIGVRPVTQDFAKRKTSDTLFILGSGPSINDLSSDDFDFIGKHDSIGFNWWIVHDFVPRFYLFQFPPNREKNISDLVTDRRVQYQGIPFVLRGTLLGAHSEKYLPIIESTFDRDSLYFLNEFPIHSKCEIEPAKLIEFTANLGFFRHNHIPPYFVKWRGSLGLLVSFGYAMGYKKIVLCGIDMNDGTAGQHFYDVEHYADARAKYALPGPEEHNIHKMMDVNYSKNTVGTYMGQLNYHVRNRNECQLFVASDQSSLSSVLPLWKFE